MCLKVATPISNCLEKNPVTAIEDPGTILIILIGLIPEDFTALSTIVNNLGASFFFRIIPS